MAQLVTVLLRKPHATQSYSLSKLQAYSLLLCFVSFLVRAFGHAVFDVSGKPKLLAEKLLGVNHWHHCRGSLSRHSHLCVGVLHYSTSKLCLADAKSWKDRAFTDWNGRLPSQHSLTVKCGR